MAPRTLKTTPALSAPIYFNRELSWLAFNRRVLAQAEDTATPLLERLRASGEKITRAMHAGQVSQVSQGSH